MRNLVLCSESGCYICHQTCLITTKCITETSHKLRGASNHWTCGCLFSTLFRIKTKIQNNIFLFTSRNTFSCFRNSPVISYSFMSLTAKIIRQRLYFNVKWWPFVHFLYPPNCFTMNTYFPGAYLLTFTILTPMQGWCVYFFLKVQQLKSYTWKFSVLDVWLCPIILW